MFEKFFPVFLVGIAVLAYFLFIGKGEYFLPSTNLVNNSHDIPSPMPKSSDAVLPGLSDQPAQGKMSLESIFKMPHQLPVRSGLPVITLLATGDVIPARSVNFQSVQRKDFLWPYKEVDSVLKEADITFINLETPLMNKCEVTQEGMRFCGDSKHIEGLVFAGVDVASLANNHAGNYGKAGIDETVKGLNGAGIKVTGVKEAAFVTVRGVKFAFLGYNDIEKTSVVKSAEEEVMKKEIGDAKKQSDVVVVTFHWGEEYVTAPGERQTMLGKLAVDSGADLVIGNHAHWIKPIQFYKDKVITYGHGNFIFDQEWSQKTKEGVAGRYVFIGKNLVDIEYLPVEIRNYGQPVFLEGVAKQKILDEMYSESKKLE